MPSEISELYKRFLNLECSAEELKQLFVAFATTDEATLKMLIEAEMETVEQEHIADDEKFQTLYHGIEARIGADVRKPPVLKHWHRIAAVAAMVTIGFCLYLWNNRHPELITVNAPFGKRLEVILPDSSHIWLNSGSTLQYPAAFEKNRRWATLKEGEAFFDIAHMQASPFIVHTTGTDVQVLGTSFEISDFKNNKDTRIAVLSGKVGVVTASAKIRTIFLLPGQQAQVNHQTYTTLTSPVNTEDIAAWRNGRLVFDDRPLAEVMSSLERAYNIKIQVDNPALLQKYVTMRLDNQPLINVLNAISFSHHFSFRKINDQLIVVK